MSLTLLDLEHAENFYEKNLNKKRTLSEAGFSETIEIKRFTKKTENAISPAMITYASEYIENFMEHSYEKWQVARGFVTNIIEVNLIFYLLKIQNVF